MKKNPQHTCQKPCHALEMTKYKTKKNEKSKLQNKVCNVAYLNAMNSSVFAFLLCKDYGLFILLSFGL